MDIVLEDLEYKYFNKIIQFSYTTKKTTFYIAQLTSVIAKTDVNESAVAFL